MNKVLYICIILGLLGGHKSCEDEREFDTTKYHRLSANIQKDMHTIDSIAQLEGVKGCESLLMLDSMRLRQQGICATLERYNLPNELLTVNDCVVKKEVIKLKSKGKAAYLRAEAASFDTLIVDFSQAVNNYKRTLQRTCVRQYNLCEKLKKQGGNKALIEGIEKLVALKRRSESSIKQDSSRILKEIGNYRNILPVEEGSPFYAKLLIALVEDVKYVISHKNNTVFCDNAHIRWSDIELAFISGDHQCEILHLEELSRRKWNSLVDSAWIFQQILSSKACAFRPRGCTCSNASNYEPLAKVDNGTCIGCLDPQAINYCPSAKQQGGLPCQYAACTERCFIEKIENVLVNYPRFVIGRDELVQVDSLCITNVCGCINPCAENYNAQASIPAVPDTCLGTICGCLDSTAVNYALRATPTWVASKYKNVRVTEHVQDSCHWRGCRSRCALNYDSLARIDDGSCQCDTIDKAQLEKKLVEMDLKAADQKFSPEQIKNEFNDYVTKRAKKVSAVDFRKVGFDLIVDIDLREMKVQSNGEQDGIPLGEYHFRPVNELIDGLIEYFNYKTSTLFTTMLEVKIVGEADAHPVRGEGIPFLNASRPIDDEFYKYIDPTTTSDPAAISDRNFDINPDRGPISMHETDKILDNERLAFVRAFMVKQKIIDAEPAIDEKRILVGAKANTEKGKKYRRIVISMVLTGFYKIMGPRVAANSTERERVVNALDFFDREGYPDGKTTYDSCPCLQ